MKSKGGQMQFHGANKQAAAVRSVIRALGGGAPFVRVGGEDGFLLCLRRRGQEIVDPEGFGAYEALSGGVFKRCRSSGPEGEGFRWLFLGPCEEEFLAAALRPDLEAMPELELDAIPADMAFQSVRAQDAAQRARPIEADAAPRP